MAICSILIIGNIFINLGQYTPQASINGNPARAGYLGSIKWSITGGANNKCLFKGEGEGVKKLK